MSKASGKDVPASMGTVNKLDLDLAGSRENHVNLNSETEKVMLLAEAMLQLVMDSATPPSHALTAVAGVLGTLMANSSVSMPHLLQVVDNVYQIVRDNALGNWTLNNPGDRGTAQ